MDAREMRSVYRTEGGATFIECGVRPGYFTDRLAAIADLATEAQRRGLLVAWS
jgi:hypothetical protein